MSILDCLHLYWLYLRTGNKASHILYVEKPKNRMKIKISGVFFFFFFFESPFETIPSAVSFNLNATANIAKIVFVCVDAKANEKSGRFLFIRSKLTFLSDFKLAFIGGRIIIIHRQSSSSLDLTIAQVD